LIINHHWENCFAVSMNAANAAHQTSNKTYFPTASPRVVKNDFAFPFARAFFSGLRPCSEKIPRIFLRSTTILKSKL